MRTAELALGLGVLLATSGMAAAVAPNCGDAVGPGGKVILDADVSGCSATALVVTGPVTLDLHGHAVSCDHTPGSIGIQALGKGVKVLNGEVSGCETGVSLEGEGKHSLQRLFVHDNDEYGLYLVGPKNKVSTCVVRGRPVSDASPTNDLVVIEPGSDKNKITGNFILDTQGDAIDFRSNGNKIAGNITYNADDSGIDENDNLARKNSVQKNITVSTGYSGIEFGGGDSSASGNLVVDGGLAGIDVESPVDGTKIQKNVILGASGTHLVDSNVNCGTTTWKKNVFTSSDPNDCIQ